MRLESRRRSAAGPVSCGGCVALAWCAGCAQILGIPSDPELVPTAGATLPAVTDAGAPGGLPSDAARPGVTDEALGAAGTGGEGRNGVPPTDGVGILAPADASALGPGGTRADAGSADAADAGPSAPGCQDPPRRAALDVIFAVDNSGSMTEECVAFEAALPRFVGRLAEAGVDYRLILVSRHRRGERGGDGEANTSLCIAAPVSGLGACPSERPALAARFFQHSIKLDAADSFERLLESFAEPDPFGLNERGWSEWLRPAARKLFIEITDADSDMPASDFVSALRSAGPEHFGPRAPGFVFHAVLGVTAPAADAAAYGPGDPIELERCGGPGSSIDSAGPVYQELSRATGGLRLSLCPPEALGARLLLLADDAVARSVLACAR